jgi:hypothetical protein
MGWRRELVGVGFERVPQSFNIDIGGRTNSVETPIVGGFCMQVGKARPAARVFCTQQMVPACHTGACHRDPSIRERWRSVIDGSRQ